MSKLRSVLKMTAAAAVGYTTGRYYEQVRDRLSLNSIAVQAAGSLPIGPAGDQLPSGSRDSTSINFPAKPQRIKEIMAHGYPTYEELRTYDNFVLSYDRRNRTAHWVFEHLTPQLLADGPAKVDRSKCEFAEDKSVHEYFRASNRDYRSSGFDRGHLAAAGNHRLHQDHCLQTFTLSNISPQVGKGFNRDKWNSLEKYVR